jgi:hypothetical protein
MFGNWTRKQGIEVSGTGLMLVSVFGPTLGIPIPYVLRLAAFFVGCGMLVIPLLSTAFQATRGNPRNRVALGGLVMCGIGGIVCLVIYLTLPIGCPLNEKLPGFFAYQTMVINDPLAFRRKFLFSVSDGEGANLGFYLSTDDVFKFVVTDINDSVHVLDVPMGESGVPLYKWIVITFNVGTASNYSCMDVSLNGKMISGQRFPFHLPLGSRNWRQITLGADRDGAQHGAFMAAELALSAATLTREETMKLVANVREYYKF